MKRMRSSRTIAAAPRSSRGTERLTRKTGRRGRTGISRVRSKETFRRVRNRAGSLPDRASRAGLLRVVRREVE